MPRPKREDLKRQEEMQRHVITMKPTTITGGFPWLALAPLAAAAATPVLGSLGKWVGKKVFGEGVRQTGAGILRAGERAPPMPPPVMMKGTGKPSIRAGDLPMPKMTPIAAHHTGTRTGLQGGFNPLGLLGALTNPVGALTGMLTGQGKKKRKGSSSMKAKMAKVRAARGKGKKKAKC